MMFSEKYIGYGTINYYMRIIVTPISRYPALHDVWPSSPTKKNDLFYSGEAFRIDLSDMAAAAFNLICSAVQRPTAGTAYF